MALIDTLQAVGGRIVKNPQTSGSSGGKFSQNNLPWSDQEDAFFEPKKLETDRANNLYPYRLLVIDVKDGNRPVSKTGFGFGSPQEFIKNEFNTGGVQYSLTGGALDWQFTLPITPKQLSITDQYAINTSATMRGVVEEHNGVKFKIITAAGTTGVWPTRNAFGDPNSGSGVALLGGTVEAIGGVERAAQILSDGGRKLPKQPDISEDNDGQHTGYFQAQLLQQFIEQYAMAKKNPANKSWRLVFDCPKTNESFVVTPMEVTFSKSERSPMETMFNLQFKAWKRIEINKGSSKPIGNELQELNPNFFQKINTSLDNARSLMSESINVIKAVRADFRKPFDTLRKVTLLAKDFAGLAVNLSDLPNQINRDITSATQKRVRDLSLATGTTSSSGEVRSRVAQSKISSTTKNIKELGDRNEGMSIDSIESGQNGTESRNAARTSPVNDIFNEPESNFDFFNSLNVDDLELNSKQINAIQDEIEINSLLSIEEVKGFIQEIQNLILDISNNFGAGDSFFSEVYNRPLPRERATPMTIEEFELLTALEDSVLQMNILTSTRQFDDVRTENPLEYVGGLADDSGIPFESSSTSKVLVPVPFGLTIQEIAFRYLRDPERYNEIITINNLKSPYIDEDGFFYTLLSNGDGRQLNIETNQNLFEGQVIRLSSNSVPTFTRKITSIEKITDTNYLITVDGLANLNLLTTNDNARLKAFLPGTVNSQNQIFIPSNLPVDDDSRTFDIPFLEEDTLTGFSKIDWLLDDSGDVVLNSFGEVALANGLNNIVQAMKIKIKTAKGDILSNPNFGLGLKPGINVTDVNVGNVLKDIRDMVLQDSRFSGVDSIDITVLPPEVSINIKAVLANGRGIFPINFTV